MKKSAFLTFIFALVPGCGQMYQGYMKRGISLLFWFAAIGGFGMLMGLEWLLVLLPVIWAYSFFDTFNLRNLSPEQRAAMGDFLIPNPTWLRQMNDGKWAKNLSSSKIIGWVLIALGVIVIYNNFWNLAYSFVWEVSPQLAMWMDRLPGLVIAVVIILLGVRILAGGKRPPDSTNDDLMNGGAE